MAGRETPEVESAVESGWNESKRYRSQAPDRSLSHSTVSGAMTSSTNEECFRDPVGALWVPTPTLNYWRPLPRFPGAWLCPGIPVTGPSQRLPL